jgi:GNAT superfamily N-acetyltransferase
MMRCSPTSITGTGSKWASALPRSVRIGGRWRFLAEAREAGGFAGLVAWRGDEAIGCACARPMPAAYPAFRQADATRVGYIWGLFVLPAERGQGLGRRLVEACLAHLAAAGCGRALLHAGPKSAPLYARLGFTATGEMALPLRG